MAFARRDPQRQRKHHKTSKCDRRERELRPRTQYAMTRSAPPTGYMTISTTVQVGKRTTSAPAGLQ